MIAVAIVGIMCLALLVAVWFAVVYSLTTPYERKGYEKAKRRAKEAQ